MDIRDLWDQEYADRLARAAQETMRAQVDLARRSAALARSALTGEAPAGETAREYARAVATEGVRLGTQTGDLVRLHLERMSAVGATIVGSAFRAPSREPADRSTAGSSSAGSSTARSSTVDARSAESPSGPPPDPPSGEVLLRGPLGGTAEGTVVVVNHHPRKRVVVLMADPLTDASGTESPAAVRVEPTRVTVPAGAEQTVHLRVALTIGEVEVGGTYRTVLRISGAQDATVPITVQVDG